MISYDYRFHGYNSLKFVYANGSAVRSQFATIKYIEHKRRSKPRFSVVVSKKVIKSAVGRNRIRRRVYEYLRNNIKNLNKNYDIVVICTSQEIKNIEHSQLTAQFDQLFEKGEIYNTSKQTS